CSGWDGSLSTHLF
nr:immunoglobulin light chain junction region [Macaca mulatta]MPO03233.1 immunoglobulin light chain junction region [Macaca mulatta]MPO03604.1 immunoglobulin light chain junction region [Macaca mulatta]MPO03621.1 immunoglobulin light chain junction region [Macaca mulatta]MPO04633.1 immunoglobulin light chain junction region [Macaca mulatta]